MQVTIRPLQESDAYISYKWRNDHEVFRFTGRGGYSQTITPECELDWLKKVIANPDEYRCAILVDGNYVGNIYLTDINKVSAVYHIFIGEKAYWGKGVAKQASRLILEYAFSRLGLQTVFLKVRKQNTRAYCLYLSLGFLDVTNEDDWIQMSLDKARYLAPYQDG